MSIRAGLVVALGLALGFTATIAQAQSPGKVPGGAAVTAEGVATGSAVVDVPAAVDAAVRKALAQIVRGRDVDEVRATPVTGVYEARVGTDLIYIDGEGKYLFWQGDLIDLAEKRNLSQERIETLTAIRFDELPLALAVRQVLGKGTRQIAVFEDPNCGFCKRMRADLLRLDDVTLYTFPLAFLAADSDSKARKALCAPDPVKAWNDLLLHNQVPDNAGTCETSIEQVRELSRELDITGTPVVFFANGKRLSGYEPPERFKARLAANSPGS